MIKIEKAKSNNSKCYTCLKRIVIGSPRGIIYPYNNEHYKRYLCKNCTKNSINKTSRELRKLKNKLRSNI